MLCNGPDALHLDDLSAVNLILFSLTNASKFAVRLDGRLNIIVKEAGLLCGHRQDFQLSKFRRRRGGFRSIHDNVFVHQDKACSKPMDKIYGLLGLKDAAETLDIVVDYSSTVQEVYRDFVWRYLQIGGMSILHYAGTYLAVSNKDRRISNLPAWATDWGSLLRDPVDWVTQNRSMRQQNSRLLFKSSKTFYLLLG
jgi:hypothetical protein